VDMWLDDDKSLVSLPVLFFLQNLSDATIVLNKSIKNEEIKNMPYYICIKFILGKNTSGRMPTGRILFYSYNLLFFQVANYHNFK
jgi:hypothetical protein